MLRVIPLAVLTLFAAPSYAEPATDDAVLAQQQQQPPQTRKRGCERMQDEGVS